MGVLKALGFGRKREAEAAKPADGAQPAGTAGFVSAAPPGFIVQLVGTNLISPLNHPGYNIESHLPKYLEAGPDSPPLKI